jgi:hypothetical protein
VASDTCSATKYIFSFVSAESLSSSAADPDSSPRDVSAATSPPVFAVPFSLLANVAGALPNLSLAPSPSSPSPRVSLSSTNASSISSSIPANADSASSPSRASPSASPPPAALALSPKSIGAALAVPVVVSERALAARLALDAVADVSFASFRVVARRPNDALARPSAHPSANHSAHASLNTKRWTSAIVARTPRATARDASVARARE